MNLCRICGQEKTDGTLFDDWVRDTFTNYDDLCPGEIICDDCLFWFEQKSVELQRRMGKDKPQKMQNYSHFVVGGAWQPVSKGDKPQMAALLLAETGLPEVAAIAVSGQKHITFRARRNPSGQKAGWVQFEEARVWVEQEQLHDLSEVIQTLYSGGFSKGEIESGQYAPYRILQFGMDHWQELEEHIRPVRKTTLFGLALFLAQKGEEDADGRTAGDGSDAAENHLAGDTCGLQEPLPDDHLGAIRKRDQSSQLHRQPGEVHQPDLFTPAG